MHEAWFCMHAPQFFSVIYCVAIIMTQVEKRWSVV